MHIITVIQQKLREIASVLAGYARDQCLFHEQNWRNLFQTLNRMTEFDAALNNASWLKQDAIGLAGREEFGELVNGRSLIYAPVAHPKSFASDMKHSTGRLMDFNKGMSEIIRTCLTYSHPKVQQLLGSFLNTGLLSLSTREPPWAHISVASQYERC